MSYFNNIKIQGIDEDGVVRTFKVDEDGCFPIEQEIKQSLSNCSTTNIAVNQFFTGIVDTTENVNAIQVVFKADQNCSIYIDQGSTSSTFEITDTFNYNYTLGGNSWTIQAVGLYFRVRVKNIGTATTTTFSLGTVTCPIVEALPRSLSNDGNLKTCVNEFLKDSFPSVKSSPIGDLRVSEHIRLVGSAFQGTNFDTNFWNKTIKTGTANAETSSTQNQMTLSTGSTANSSIIVNSVRTGRYISGNSNFYRAVVNNVATSGNCIKRWGVFTSADGLYFETSSSSNNFSVNSRKGAVSTRVKSGYFNGVNGTEYILDNLAHTYEIYWTNKSVWFFVDDTFIHKMTGTIAPLTNTNNFKIGMECTNYNGTTNNNKLEVRVASISRIGNPISKPTSKLINANGTFVLKYGPGTLHAIIFAAKGSNNNVINIYDNITNSNLIFGPLDTTTILSNEISFGYAGLDFYTGLTIVLSTGTASVLTVIYE